MRNNQEIHICEGIENVDISSDGFVYVFVNKTSDFVPAFSGKMSVYYMKYQTAKNIVFVRF
jgi:hypothetical protein